MSRHPGDDRLLQWLDEPDSVRVDDHIELCDQCADRLDELTGGDPPIGDALREALPVADDLEPRILGRVTADLEDAAAAETFVDLLGIGFEALRTVFGEEREP